MKTITKYLIFAVVTVLSFTACERHDPLDDIAIIGGQGPNVYWEIPDLNATAGQDVKFKAQYWTEDNTIAYLGVWYDISVNYIFSATRNDFAFTYSEEPSELVREFQEIVDLTDMHNESLWVDSERNYVLEASFPISHTLTSTNLTQPDDFDMASETIEKFFPKDFETKFKEGLYPKLIVVNDSTKLLKFLTVDFPRTDTLTVRSFYESVFDENAGAYITVFTEEGKESVKSYLTTIPFDSLTYNNNANAYDIIYEKSFNLGARFRVVNGEGIATFSDANLGAKEITVN